MELVRHYLLRDKTMKLFKIMYIFIYVYIIYIIYTLCFHPNHKVINKLFHMHSGEKFQDYFTIFILRARVANQRHWNILVVCALPNNTSKSKPTSTRAKLYA